MKYKLHYSRQSKHDLEEVWNQIAIEYQNISSAAALVESIENDIDRLTDFPQLGPVLSSIADVESDYRFLLTGKYLTFYRVTGTDIYIDRIIYGRRDYLRILLDTVADGEE